MDHLIAWMPALVLAGVALALGFRRRSQPRERALSAFARATKVPIGEIKNGTWAKVTGVVGVVGAQMTSPISGRECIGFWSEVDDRQGRVVLKEDGCGVFSITDDTGQAIVEGPVLLAFEIEDPWSIAPVEQVELLQRIGGSLDEREFDVREELLRPGDRASVLGLAFLEPDPTEPAAGHRSPAIRPHLRGTKDQPIVLAAADDDHVGG